MKIVETSKQLKQIIFDLKKENKTIGFVPTMGALHAGHLSLVKQSKAKTDYTVVSIFVNPTQFNNKSDLANYPRTLQEDISKLEKVANDILFIPNETEMYPENDTRTFDFGYLDKILEGEFRPGHFNGVAQIVSKLFELTNPDIAFFGLKDYQQYIIIKELERKYLPNQNIKIRGCDIYREANGLAMSSRNERLSTEQRENAGEIFKTLELSKRMLPENNIEQIKDFVVNRINNNKFLEVEYFEIIDKNTLKPTDKINRKDNLLAVIAVFCGEVRLIDNLIY